MPRVAATTSTQSPRRRSSLARLVGLPLVLLLATAATAEQSVAPDWTLETVDGAEVRFHAQARGAPAVLVFWASWCPHCRALLPHLQALQDEFAPRGVHFYALNIWEDGDAAGYFRRHRLTVPLFLTADLVAEDYGVDGTPAVIVIAPDLTIRRLPIDGVAPVVVASTLRADLLAQLAAVTH